MDGLGHEVCVTEFEFSAECIQFRFMSSSKDILHANGAYCISCHIRMQTQMNENEFQSYYFVHLETFYIIHL